MEKIVKTLQYKNLQYNKNFYQREAHKYIREGQDEILLKEEELDDPRDLEDIEKENMDLKE